MSELQECYRGGAIIQECDAFGHLNIAYYVERFADAAHELLARLGPALRYRTTAISTRYVSELRAGDPIAIASGVIAVADRTAIIGHVATNGQGGPATTVTEQTVAIEDADAAALVAAAVTWHEQRFAPVSLPEKPGPLATSLSRVKIGESDGAGNLSLFGFVDRFSTANLVNMNAAGMTTTYMRGENRGFATFETRLELFLPLPRLGEAVAIHSGMLDAGKSSVRMVHEMSLARSGRRVARFYQAGVHFDLEARRSAPLPDWMRHKVNQFLISKD
jgi:acyl-CoA thioesterase FadM